MARPFSSSHLYDAVVVGSGATGGWAAMQLAHEGLDVLVLEAGRPLDPQVDFEVGGWTRARREVKASDQPVQARHGAYWRLSPDLFVDDREHPYLVPEGQPFSWIRSRNVGGRSNLWGGICLRLSPYEMETRSRYGYGEDWPFSYAELSPYYARAERLFGVQGSFEGLPQLPDGDFVQPRAMTAGELRFKRAVESTVPGARVMSSRCIVGGGTGHQAGDLAPVVSSVGTTLRLALATGRVTLRTDAIASHLLVDAESRACAVACIDRVSRQSFEARGRAFVLCASTIESTRVLLHSTSPSHPKGLGNSSGLLGKNLMDHVAVWVAGGSGAEPRGEQAPFGGPDSIYIPRRVEGEQSPGIRGGYGIWGGIERAVGMEAAGRPCSFFLLSSGEMLPSVDNAVTLSSDRRDAFGLPVPQIACSPGAEDLALAQDAKQLLRRLAEVGGLEVTLESEAPLEAGLFVHEVGTARMGRDERTSCLDPYNSVWDANNVFVTDGACWPTSAYQNPTLTMLAVTARSCDRIASLLRSGEL